MTEQHDTKPVQSIWTYESGRFRAIDIAQRWQVYFNAGGEITWSQNIRRIAEPVPAEVLAQWTAEAPAQIARLVAKRATDAERAAKLAGSIKAGFPGTCALTGKRIAKGDHIKRFGSGWALALEMGAGVAPARRDRHEDTEALDGGEWLDAERRNHERDELATMRREMAAEQDF